MNSNKGIKILLDIRIFRILKIIKFIWKGYKIFRENIREIM